VGTAGHARCAVQLRRSQRAVGGEQQRGGHAPRGVQLKQRHQRA
jgi:hypothetical protein